MARTDLSTGPASSPTAAEIIGQLTGAPETPAFALLRRTDPETGEPGPVELLLGRVTEADRISGIPLPGKGATGPGTLALVPFRQIRERGLACHDDATPSRCWRSSGSTGSTPTSCWPCCRTHRSP